MLVLCGVQGEGVENSEIARECIARGVIAVAVPVLIEKMEENKDYKVIIAGYSLGKQNKIIFSVLDCYFQSRRWYCPTVVSRARTWSLSQPAPSQQ